MSRYEGMMLWKGTAVLGAFVAFEAFVLWAAPGRGALGLAVLGFVGFVALALGAQQAATRGARGPMLDEREGLIDARAEQLAYRTLEAGCFAVILALLMGWLEAPRGIVAALVAAVACAGVTRAWGALWMARRG